MTSQKEQIQSLIADIDQVLAGQKPSTPWIKASEIEPQRRVLARARTYLKSLQLLEVSERRDQVESTKDLLRTLRTEMTFLKSSALQPLRLEIDNLQSVKAALQQEVEALEKQRSHINQVLAEQSDQPRSKDIHPQIDEAQLNQFLTVLMERFQENLSVLVTQQLTQTSSDRTAVISASSAAEAHDQAVIEEPAKEPDQLNVAVESEALVASPKDTVASLDEILPRQLENDELAAEANDTEPATFISGDSTIDDSLGHDVDRKGEQAESESSESMADVATTAEITEAETEDHDIESKVLPTADALFLANLTIVDLTEAQNADELSQANAIDQNSLDSKRNNLVNMSESDGSNHNRDSHTKLHDVDRVLESSLNPNVMTTEEMSDKLSLEEDDSTLSEALQSEQEKNNQASIISALEATMTNKGLVPNLEEPTVSKWSEDIFISRASSPNVLVHKDSALIPDESTNSTRSSNQLEDSQQSHSSQRLLAEQSNLVQSNLEDLSGTRLHEPADSKKKESVQPPDHKGFAPKNEDQPASWYLGIDLGTTGLSVVLMEQRTHRMYELYWSVSGDSEAKRFRLPTVAAVARQEVSGQLGIGAVGPAALQDIPLLRSLKPMLKIGIPDDVSGEPWIQWSERISLPLLSLQTAVCDLLRTLSPGQMSCQAMGLEDDVLRRALTNLQGVIIGYPTNWPDTYSFNIREAALSAGLVATPEQVFFVEDTIAALLSALPASTVDVSNNNQQLGLYNCNWSGGTVVLSAGATLTEVAIAHLPTDLAQLSYSDFASRSYTYAGDSVDQDIICQLLLPIQSETSTETKRSSQPSADDWESLKLHQLKLPRPGEANRISRHRLAQRLNDSSLGQQALGTARDLKIMLQENEKVTVQLGNRNWVITRKDLETKVFFPYVQRINRLTNTLLNQKSLSPESIKQVICTGGAASLTIVSDWLRQQFPNATIIQDTYSGEYSNSCSRIAYGLANLCHYPAVLDSARHRYNDYFLLLELLRTLPEQPLPAGGIMHLLSKRGVDIQTCQAHLLALIEGHLPPGLVPTEGDRPLISAQTSDIDSYRLLAELPLFRKQGGQIYIADFEQGERLRSHLESLLTTKAQSLDKPMATDTLTAQEKVE